MRLSNRAWDLAWAAGLLLAGASAVVWAAAVPARYAELAAFEAPGLPPGWAVQAWRAALDNVGLAPESYALFAVGAEGLVAVTFFMAGAMVLWRRPLGWVPGLAAFSLLLAGPALSSTLAGLASLGPVWQSLGVLVRIAALVALMLLGAVFPNGRFVPGQLRWLVVAWAGYLAVAALIPSLAVPLAWWRTTSPGGWLTLAITAGGLAAAALAQIYRYRRTRDRLVRQQIKWLLFGLGVAGLGNLVVLAASSLLLWTRWAAGLSDALDVLFTLGATTIVSIGILAWPFSLALAVLRQQLWDVDFAIHRALVYGPVLAALGVVFVLALHTLTWLLPKEHVLTFTLAAILAGALFRSVRRAVRAWVDRRIYGIRIEYNPPATPAPPEPADVPNHLGPYRRLEPARLGGLGEVYRSLHPALGRPVALKLLPPDFAAEHGRVDQLRRDVAAAAGLEHPHLARLYETGETNGWRYIVTEYCVGQDLGSFMLINGRLAPARALPLLRDLAAGLDYAHTQGQVHGAVTLANVMLVLKEQDQLARDARFPARAAFLPTTAFRTVLLGMGLEAVLAHRRRPEALAYLAPEQIRGAPLDARTDIYGLGVLAYFMLAGMLPFPQSNRGALVIAHLRQAPPDPRARVIGLENHIALALLRVLSKDPAERFPTATEFVQALSASGG